MTNWGFASAGARAGTALIARLALAVMIAVCPIPAAARHVAYTASTTDLGGVGLMQTRTARFGPDGLFISGASFVDPYERLFVSLQFLPGIEATFRYTSFENRETPFRSSRGRISAKDKGADVKVRLLRESKYVPAIAVGLQDLVGTAAFGGEYIVASKRYYDLDFSLGIGWGRLGTRGHFKNPLTFFADRFRTRGGGGGGTGGKFAFADFFSGERVALFGGVEYLTPIKGLRLKLEYDSNSYQNEPFGNKFEVDSPFNVGVGYHPYPFVDLSLGLERGNTLMVRAALTPNLNTAKPVFKITPSPVPLLPRSEVERALFASDEETAPLPRDESAPAAEVTAARLFDGLEKVGFVVETVDLSHTAATVWVLKDGVRFEPETVARAARVVADALPLPLDSITFVAVAGEREVERVTVRRDELDMALALGTPMAQAGSHAGAPEGRKPASETGEPSPELTHAVAPRLSDELDARGFKVEAVDLTRTRATVYVAQGPYRSIPQVVGRVARVVAGNVPVSVEEITVVTIKSGLETGRTTILRSDLERALTLRGSPEEIWAHAELEGARAALPRTALRNPDRYPSFAWSLTPQLRQHIGGFERFYLWQLWARLAGELQLTRGLSITGVVGQNIVGTLDQLEFGTEDVPLSRRGTLPPVRSDLKEYILGADNFLARLEADYVWNIAPDWFGRLSAGIFEEMYGGISGEVLYRPFASRWAVGLDVNRVWQREFDGRFRFRDYRVTTGHLSIYYDIPFNNLHGTVNIGRYLARDIGITFALGRAFDSGMVIGAFTTFTNVSPEEFGEGSFDKGFFVSIPLDLLSIGPTGQVGDFLFRPLTRNGGQAVAVGKRLFRITAGYRLGSMADNWRSILY